MSAVRFRVWPGVDAEYYAYYLAGLGETFGPTSLRFSAAGFPELSQRHLLFVDEATGLRVCIPPVRELPAPLLHGVHAHFVTATEAAAGEALERIRRQPEYRAFLEKNARRYYLEELQPRRAIERLYARAGAALR